ncbi:MAG: helix-turn-helix transcriptional regulator [Bacteroidia bacterium]|nr:helix-turn-helix transcriptional regulator [Bacteroidia bacterium]
METVEFHRSDGKKLNIEIIKYKPEDLPRNKTPNRHRHDFHAIFFIQEGTSLQEIDFEDYHITSNQVMLIPEGAVHWEKEIIHMSGYTILFKNDFFSNAQKRLLDGLMDYAVALRKLLIDMKPEVANQIIPYFELLMLEQAEGENQNQTFILQNLMLALLNKLEGLMQSLPESQSFVKYRGPFQNFVQLVENSFTQQNKLDFYAEKLNMTKRKLNEAVKLITGQTAANFIIDRIILEAKRELSFSGKSIKELAFELGYESQYYFSRIFKNRTGKSPEQFRETYAE